MMDMVIKAAATFDVIHFHTDLLHSRWRAHCPTPASHLCTDAWICRT